MKILLVEDDLEISKLLAEFLQENGYEVFCQYDGLHVLDCLRENNIDLILLDIMLPYRNGDTVLTAVRECSTVPIIIISAKGTTQNKIDLLRLGADDYITKPFDMEEVLARIESNLRRVQFQKDTPTYLRHGDLILDLNDNTAFLQGSELTLTAKEFAILELLNKMDTAVTDFFNKMSDVLERQLGDDEVYAAVIAPEIELTITPLANVRSYLPCFDEADSCYSISEDVPLALCYDPRQVITLAGKRYLSGAVVFVRYDTNGSFVALTTSDLYLIQCYLAENSVPLMAGREKMVCICID